jgi:hypothetical protein
MERDIIPFFPSLPGAFSTVLTSLPGDPIKGPEGVEGHWVQRRDPVTNNKIGCEFVSTNKTIVASSDACEYQKDPASTSNVFMTPMTIFVLCCLVVFAILCIGVGIYYCKYKRQNQPT